MNEELWQFVGYRCVVGSQAYGLATEESDFDRRGFYLPPASLHWSLAGVPEQLEREETQEVYWELEKFLKLALQSNPNVLETLSSPLVEFASPLAEEVRDMQSAFLSKIAFERYEGYAKSQFSRLQTTFEERAQVNWKHAMHLIRLLIAGAFLLREGTVLVDVSPWRDDLLSIRRGEWDWARLIEWRTSLEGELQLAYAGTSLPAEPDRKVVGDFLLRARRSVVDF